MQTFGDIFGCEKNIICEPMAWIGTYELISEVINEGAAGYLGIGNANAKFTKAQISSMRERCGNKPFGVNILSTNPKKERDKVLEVILENSDVVRYVSLSAFSRPPKNIVQALREKGIKVIARIGREDYIPLWERVANPDLYDAEGRESGGHLGPKYTKDLLLPALEIAAKYDKPVVAAAGFYDYEDYKWAIGQGAVGVGLGSRFAVAKPSIAHRNYKLAVKEAKGKCTHVTGSSIGHPVRALKNPFTIAFETLEDKLEKLVKKSKMSEDSRKEMLSWFGTGAMEKGLIDGDVELGSLMIGEKVAPRIKEINEEIPDIINSVLGYKKVVV